MSDRSDLGGGRDQQVLTNGLLEAEQEAGDKGGSSLEDLESVGPTTEEQELESTADKHLG